MTPEELQKRREVRRRIARLRRRLDRRVQDVATPVVAAGLLARRFRQRDLWLLGAAGGLAWFTLGRRRVSHLADLLWRMVQAGREAAASASTEVDDD